MYSAFQEAWLLQSPSCGLKARMEWSKPAATTLKGQTLCGEEDEKKEVGWDQCWGARRAYKALLMQRQHQEHAQAQPGPSSPRHPRSCTRMVDSPLRPDQQQRARRARR